MSKPPELTEVRFILTTASAWKISVGLVSIAVSVVTFAAAVNYRFQRIEEHMVTSVQYQQIRDDAAGQNPPVHLPPLPRRAELKHIPAALISETKIVLRKEQNEKY